ncbi:probable 4-coumarate--CoA ligase 1 [Episyrphus balteatus]|uniref:probable 4-coumarate--CoA ligase 1 n=1 Tax=Episyrphus balteatus TaxID=286459 RepID=UPI002485E5EE|nr:probable 4-coumarate--CoA ligase 1 [Episyrphus balteatus]XP_055842282.1 probable 4-coumarate--CoA ligase 1 [Episyrphus balteatus]
MIRTTSCRLTTQCLNVLRSTTVSSNCEKRYQGNIATERSGDGDKNLQFTNEEGYWKTSSFETVFSQNTTLDKYVWRNIKQWENKIASVCVITGRQYTYAKLRDSCAAFAIQLQHKFKLNPRDVIAICLPNLPEYPIASLGSIEAGLTVTTVNPLYTAEEIGRQLTMSNAKCVIGTVKYYNVLKNACSIAKKNLPIIVIPTKNNESIPAGAINFFEIINTANVDYSLLKDAGISPKDVVLLPFSSGTTGLPKGVQLSHENITINCEQIQAKLPDEASVLETTETQQEVIPCVLPFFHIYGLTVVMLSKLFLGIKLVTLPQFKPEDLIKALHEYKGTSLNLVPPIANFLTNSPKVTPEHLAHLRMFMSGAAPIGQADVERMLKKFPNTKFMQGYGMTELSPVAMITPNNCVKYGSIGQLVSNTEAKIVSLEGDDGKGLGPNATGELLVRGPQTMIGYLNNDEANKDIFREGTNGSGKWLRTGDVAYYDEDGLFYITDRMKELIKVKGFQVPPAELEECLRNHPKILEAGVIGIPHSRHGEIPRAFVVLKPNVEATEEEIIEFVAERVAHYKHLEGGVQFIKELPKNSTGKILRKDLKSM